MRPPPLQQPPSAPTPTPNKAATSVTRCHRCTSHLTVNAWHTYLNDPRLADAILDRVVHSSHKIELKRTRSMREAEAAQAA